MAPYSIRAPPVMHIDFRPNAFLINIAHTDAPLLCLIVASPGDRLRVNSATLIVNDGNADQIIA